ncbi:MAG: FemAB family XrtA/PEP-CTERM system-associated protein [Burkholderiales bacterium]
MQVTEAAQRDRDRWDAFVHTCPEATFFHRFGWKPLIERVFGHRTFFLMAERGGDIEGVMPLVQVKSMLFGHGLVSLPFGVYGGPAGVSDEAAHALTDAAVKLAGDLGAKHLELRNRAALNPQWPRQDLYVTFRKEILADEEANMLAIPRKQRAMVRKGIKAGLRSEIDSGTERFFQLYAGNVHRHGTPPFPKRYFDALKEEFGEDVEALIVVDAQGVSLSGVLSFYFRDEVLPYYAGDDPRARDVAANDFKYWELMRRACARGLRVFDYGRSKRGTGSFDFKKNWGFEPQPLHYEYWLSSGDRIPQNNPSNPKYKAFIALWRRMPRPVANVLGPYLSRHLG